MSKIWLVTGSARGLGRFIVEAALAAGNKVLATARDPGRLDALVVRYPDTLKTFSLDVTDAAAAQQAVDFAVAQFGGLDVLVNNAGYGHIVPFEQTEADAFRQEVETNLFGVVNLSRAALPVLRAQKSGHIINVSSVGGRVGIPGLSAYQAAKWAVGGFTEVLAQEARPFGVKVIAIEPGGMRTDWGFIAGEKRVDILPDYAPSVGAVLGMIGQYAGGEIGDPAKVAQVILDLTARDELPPHLLLGSDALQVFAQVDDARRKATEEWAPVSRSIDAAGIDISGLTSQL
jgi:NAD(P)-dependent dehydrogenase (short-subunit alcohol dehydrogenase family)